MKYFFDVQINELRKELEKKVILLVKRLADEIPRESDTFIERLCLLSGISKERLMEIRAYTSEPEVTSEWGQDDEGKPYDKERVLEKNSLNVTIQEIHSLCNVISFFVASNQGLDGNSVVGDIAENSDSIIERWVEMVNYYCDCSDNLFDGIIKKSGMGSFEEFFSTYHVFVDTSALCDENTKDFLDILISEIKNIPEPLKITIPKAVVDCLQDMVKDAEQNFLFGADEGLRNLNKIQEAGLLSVRGDGADTTVMSTFLSAFSRFKPVYRMMLITQDEALANAVEMLNTSGVEGAEILICRVTEANTIELWFEDETSGEGEGMASEESSQEELITPAIEDIPSEERFADGILPVEESMLDDVIPTETDESESDSTDTELGFEDDDHEEKFPDEDIIDEGIETDIEKMSMLEEQLANMLGKNTKHEEDSDDDELSDDDDFEDDDDESGESKKDIDFDFSEDDTLNADAFKSDSWSVLD